MTQELLDAAIYYAELGYSVFPCVPGAKTPLTAKGHLDATSDLKTVEAWWAQQPAANVAIATQGMLILDLDRGNRWHAHEPDRLLELASAPLALTANGGRQYLFRQPEGKRYRNTAGKLAPQVDTRADGGYIVVPPSVLEGDKHYRWAPGMELEVEPAGLPEPPAWVVEELERASNGAGPSTAPGCDGVIGNQIPAGQRNSTLASLAGTMRRVGMSESEIIAALWRVNLNRCSPPLDEREVQRIAASVARYEPDQISVALAEGHYAQMHESERVELQGDENPDPGAVPDELLEVPGFVGEVMNYTLETAPYPEPILAFCGALALQAFLAGRKVRDPADNRTNLYILGLANTGAGKDYPRKVNQRVLMHAGLAESIGDTFASGEGIEDRLFVRPAMLFQTDEIDALMAKINLAKDARHEGIMNVLLKMYTSANGLYPMRVKAGNVVASLRQELGQLDDMHDPAAGRRPVEQEAHNGHLAGAPSLPLRGRAGTTRSAEGDRLPPLRVGRLWGTAGMDGRQLPPSLLWGRAGVGGRRVRFLLEQVRLQKRKVQSRRFTCGIGLEGGTKTVYRSRHVVIRSGQAGHIVVQEGLESGIRGFLVGRFVHLPCLFVLAAFGKPACMFVQLASCALSAPRVARPSILPRARALAGHGNILLPRDVRPPLFRNVAHGCAAGSLSGGGPWASTN